MDIQRDLKIAPQTLSENTPSCTCDANYTKMCGHECGECGHYTTDYEGGYCKYYEKAWKASANACEHYY